MIQAYTETHGDYIRQTRFNERTGTIKSKRFVHVDYVLEIIDSHKYSICWSETEKLWNDRMDGIKAAVLALKGGTE